MSVDFVPRSVSIVSFVVCRKGNGLDTELVSADVCTTYSEDSEEG